MSDPAQRLEATSAAISVLMGAVASPPAAGGGGVAVGQAMAVRRVQGEADEMDEGETDTAAAADDKVAGDAEDADEGDVGAGGSGLLGWVRALLGLETDEEGEGGEPEEAGSSEDGGHGEESMSGDDSLGCA
jgi:hypothetical protein